jgi:hypothetical protein
MTTYHLRDSNGVLKAVIPKKNAMGIFTEVDGTWKPYKSEKHNSRAYHITRGVSWTFFQNRNDEIIIQIMLWEGDYLVEVHNDY